MEESDICKSCGYIFRNKGNDGVPCPMCGGKNRIMSPSVHENIGLSDFVGWKSKREFYEKNRALFWVIVIITVISPFLGLLFAGIPGVFVGLLLAGASYFLGPHAATKVREIERG